MRVAILIASRRQPSALAPVPDTRNLVSTVSRLLAPNSCSQHPTVTPGYYINIYYESQDKPASARGYKMSLPESKCSAAEPQPNRGTAIPWKPGSDFALSIPLKIQVGARHGVPYGDSFTALDARATA